MQYLCTGVTFESTPLYQISLNDQVTSGVPPECLEKIELPEARTIIEQCIRLKKEERPSAKQLLELPFFSDFKLDLLNREILASNQETMVKFRLQVTDPKTQKIVIER